jgi:uncharacterized repeat protein (TIGR02543 family)
MKLLFSTTGLGSLRRIGQNVFTGLSICVLGAMIQPRAVAVTTIYTVGDSTMSNYAASSYPQSGWGQQLHFFFNSANVVVSNRAVGGTSSKSFYDNQWPAVRNSLKAGDFVFIQFGINDAKKDDPARFTMPFTTFKDFLTKFVNETKAKGAFPVLVSTQNRNAWTGSNPDTIYPAYHDYPVATRQLAGEIHVPLVDLDQRCKALLESVGKDYSTNFIYLHADSGEYPRFPNGNADDVHFKEMGAIEMAKLVVAGIRALGSDVNVSKLIPQLTPTFPVTFSANTSAGGAITRSENFPAGITVTAQARPASGWTFSGWTGSLTGTNRTTTFVMGAAPRTIMATFVNGSGGSGVFQGESAVISPGVSESTNAGFKGSGYANTDNVVGSFVEWTVNVSTAGTYTLDFRFANGGATNRPADLRVNGTVAQAGLAFPSTGAFTTWSDVSVRKALNAGSNKVRLTATTAGGCANLDQLTITP